jgi:hypothetical protein
VRTAARLASHFRDRFFVHFHDGVIAAQPAFAAIGINALSCRILLLHTASSRDVLHDLSMTNASEMQIGTGEPVEERGEFGEWSWIRASLGWGPSPAAGAHFFVLFGFLTSFFAPCLDCAMLHHLLAFMDSR